MKVVLYAKNILVSDLQVLIKNIKFDAMINDLNDYSFSHNSMYVLVTDMVVEKEFDGVNIFLISNNKQNTNSTFYFEFDEKGVGKIKRLIQKFDYTNKIAKADTFKEVTCTFNHHFRNKLLTLQMFIINPDLEKAQSRQEDIKDLLNLLKKIEDISQGESYSLRSYFKDFNLIKY